MKKVQIDKSQRNTVNLLIVFFILIILYLHHGFVTTDYIGTYREFRMVLIFFSVGGFIFLSAYKLTSSKKDASLKSFWLNRFARIYPLYILALVMIMTFVSPGFNSIGNFIKHLLLLQNIFPDLYGFNYPTIYFVGLLNLYYLFFSFTKSKLADYKKFLAISTFLLILIFTIKLLLYPYIRIVTANFFPYFIIFISGMLYSYNYQFVSIFMKKYRWWFFALISLLLPILVILLNAFNAITLRSFNSLMGYPLLILTLVISVLLLSVYPYLMMIRISSIRFSKYLSHIAYASFAIFLFHPSIWQIMMNYYYERSLGQFLYIVLLGTMLIFCFSYLIQFLYDKLRKKLASRKWFR